MIYIISPAKTLDFTNQLSPLIKTTQPQFVVKSEHILQTCKMLTTEQIKKLMNISDKLADINYQRLLNFAEQPSKPAIFAYAGDVYNHIQALELDSQSLNFLTSHLLIISGLYGVLRPLDSIRPYRLEMSTRLDISHLNKYHTEEGLLDKSNDLATFWQQDITDYINQVLASHENKYLINLASTEYSLAIKKSKLKYPIINIHFKENKKGKLQTIGIEAKKARGTMINIIAKNLVDKPDQLKDFSERGYCFSSTESSKYDWVFIKDSAGLELNKIEIR